MIERKTSQCSKFICTNITLLYMTTFKHLWIGRVNILYFRGPAL